MIQIQPQHIVEKDWLRFDKTKDENRNIWLAYSWNKAKPNAFEWYIGQSFNSFEIIIAFTASRHSIYKILGK